MNYFGTHNSWTFRKPVKWYLKPLYFLARCQQVNIKEQLKKYNCTLFDLRIKFINNVPCIHHGNFNYGTVDNTDLIMLNDNNCYLRIILESNKEMSDQKAQEFLFHQYCFALETRYPNIKLCAGRRKYDGQVIYKCKYDEPEYFDRYSSVTSLFKSNNKFLKIIDDWCPYIYAKLKNKDNFKEFTNEDRHTYYFSDFINIR